MTTTDIQPTWPASQTCRRDKRVLITGPAATLRTDGSKRCDVRFVRQYD
jgi:hypothetical protein